MLSHSGGTLPVGYTYFILSSAKHGYYTRGGYELNKPVMYTSHFRVHTHVHDLQFIQTNHVDAVSKRHHGVGIYAYINRYDWSREDSQNITRPGIETPDL